MTAPAPTVTLRYWAAARAAAGRVDDTVQARTLAEAVTAAEALHADSDRFAAVLQICSVLQGETPVCSVDPHEVLLADGDVLEFLPPFAGG